MKKKQTLDFIYNGAIDFYCALKIETKLSFEKMCESIQNNIDVFLMDYRSCVKSFFSTDIEKAVRERGLHNTVNIKDAFEPHETITTEKASKSKGEICSIPIDLTNNGVKIMAITNVDNYFSQMREESQDDYGYSKDVYGNMYANSQKRFLLPPVEIEMKNESVVLLSAVLFVFKNKTAVLRMTLPIDNVDTQPLIRNKVNDYILNAKTFYGFSIELQDKSISAIQDCYCRFLMGIKKIQSIRCYKRITNVIIANHSAMFDNVKNIPDEVKEEIYKISVAPIQDIRGVSYLEDAIHHFEKNGKFFHGVGYIASSMGKCVSIVDNSIVNFIKENVEPENVFRKIINNVRRSVEFTITLLLLKKTNDSYTFEQKGMSSSNLVKVKNDYNRDKIFISLLQSGVYGSVRELTEAFENNMTFFLDAKNVEDRMIAVNEIVEEEKSRRTAQLQNLMSIIGLIFTIIIGLPAINETLFLIRKLCCFIQKDIPFLSVDNCSFIIWLLVTLGLTLFVILKSKIKKFE